MSKARNDLVDAIVDELINPPNNPPEDERRVTSLIRSDDGSGFIIVFDGHKFRVTVTEIPKTR